MLTMMMVILHNFTRKKEHVPERCREGVEANLFKQGDKADPENYRGITLPSTVEDFER